MIAGADVLRVPDELRGGDLLDDDRLRTVSEQERSGLTGALDSLLEVGESGAADVEAGEQWCGEGDHAQPQPVAACEGALDVPLVRQARQDPGHRALVKVDQAGDLRDPELGALGGEALEDPQAVEQGRCGPLR